MNKGMIGFAFALALGGFQAVAHALPVEVTEYITIRNGAWLKTEYMSCGGGVVREGNWQSPWQAGDYVIEAPLACRPNLPPKESQCMQLEAGPDGQLDMQDVDCSLVPSI